MKINVKKISHMILSGMFLQMAGLNFMDLKATILSGKEIRSKTISICIYISFIAILVVPVAIEFALNMVAIPYALAIAKAYEYCRERMEQMK